MEGEGAVGSGEVRGAGESEERKDRSLAIGNGRNREEDSKGASRSARVCAESEVVANAKTSSAVKKRSLFRVNIQ
jgi:hypothetical protein